jgi:hypothetical protein
MKDSVNNEAGGSYSNHCAINGKILLMTFHGEGEKKEE